MRPGVLFTMLNSARIFAAKPAQPMPIQPPPPRPRDPLELLTAMQTGELPCSALQEPLLVLDAHRDWQDAALHTWLRRLPCPVIALGGQDNALSRACDLRLDDAAPLAALAARVRRWPLASTVLVQLLRLQRHLPLEDALQAESLAYATLQGGVEYRRWLQERGTPEPLADDEDGPELLLARDDETLLLTLNRPQRRNSMTVAMRDALNEALALVQADPGITQVQLSARGKCFSTGGELREFGSASDPASAHIIRSLTLPGRQLARVASRVQVQLHGACIGSGIEFPAFAARLIARRDAWFQLPELQYGLIPGAGGTVSIAQRIGAQRLAWMVLSGKRIDADTALAWGLVDAITD
ncbi:Enoyl-CoA hydratase/carnithine racemase [Solimonas aquatica]|uniref:Enoyl-CoA hydratase/carnithine racemase n=2 Tax=Solimonas aquatica TaxID=489703 RepID=A0A1H9J4B7_9GAMM|nr:Enoyl-CoA hydratase/carnithine racemase [Solimonas aquatica]